MRYAGDTDKNNFIHTQMRKKTNRKLLKKVNERENLKWKSNVFDRFVSFFSLSLAFQ